MVQSHPPSLRYGGLRKIEPAYYLLFDKILENISDMHTSKKFPRRYFLLIVVILAIAFSCHFRPEPADPIMRAPASWPEVSDFSEYNLFEEREGLFNFYYKNILELKEEQGIYFLRDLKNGRVVFQIFENRNDLDFAETDFICQTYQGQRNFSNREICHTRRIPQDLVVNLDLFTASQPIARDLFSRLVEKDFIISAEYDPDAFFTRAEAVKLALRMRYPKDDFSDYADDCFTDVAKDDPLAGYICFAKEKKIVSGIDGYFYPDRSINLWFTKILFATFGITDYDFNENVLDLGLFSQMQTQHNSYPFIGKSYYEGIIQNPRDEIFWTNRGLRRGEVLQIAVNFLSWYKGKMIKQYDYPDLELPEAVIYQREDEIFELDEIGDAKFVPQNMYQTKLLASETGVEVFIPLRGNIYTRLLTLPDQNLDDIQSVEVNLDWERLKGQLQIQTKFGEIKNFELYIPNKTFVFLKDAALASTDSITRIEKMGLLPNEATLATEQTIPQLNIYLAPEDLENLFINRTSNERYPAFLEMSYPDQSTDSYSILLKTRGNATRGYIKSSFTIESFKDFKDNKKYPEDDFIDDSDEFKLRSFINEETMIHEKLFYHSFKKLGHPAPKFFSVMLTINDIPMGLYQVTEAISKQFFTSRGIATDHYYYSRNNDSLYTNLTFHRDDESTLTQYKLAGDPRRLLDFIQKLDANDPALIEQINVENVFDYALLCFLANAPDSLSHNFYVYFDAEDGRWNIFPWDADASFRDMRELDKKDFLSFALNHEGIFNNLIYYTFRNMDRDDFEFYLENFVRKWRADVDVLAAIDYVAAAYEDYFEYDNALWNGKFIERKEAVFDTLGAIEELRGEVEVWGW